MKRERRRNARIPVETQVIVQVDDGAGQLRAVTTDLGEGGMAVQLAHRPKNLGTVTIQFSLPGSEQPVECKAQIAWENPGRQVGLRFVDTAPELRDRLKAWLESRAPEFEEDDPPSACKLTDLSLGGCYLETGSPFPLRTRIILSLQAGGQKRRAEGVVLVMHPDVGMGIEFAQSTGEQREQVEQFIHTLTSTNGALPEIFVEPEGLESTDTTNVAAISNAPEDPLLGLFRKRGDLTPEAFRIELSKQRHPAPKAASRKATV
jgi:c-di-GMP-binding flagellar brake protein YcgR